MIGKMTARDIWPTIKQTFSEWLEDKATKMAAALAYYCATSIAPMLVIAVWLITRFYGDQAPDKLRTEIASLTDNNVGAALQQAITNSYHSNAGGFATVVSIVIGVLSASGVFAELQDSLNTIWEVRPKPDRGLWGIVHDRFLSMTMVLGVAFLLLVSTVLSAILSAMSAQLVDDTVGSTGSIAKVAAFTTDLVLSTGVVTVLFAAMFKWLPDVRVSWRDVWLGGFFTAVLFEIGKYGLGVYIGKAAPGSAFGAVGSIVAMLVWVFYSAQILFFGAEFTQVYANKFGTHIVPAANAEPLTEAMREQAGNPHTDCQPAGKPKKSRSHRSIRLPTTTQQVSKVGKSMVELGIPMFTMAVVGRFFWKRWQ